MHTLPLALHRARGKCRREREQQQFLAQNKYFSLQHLLPRNYLSPQHWPGIYRWAARNHAIPRSHFHWRLFPLSVSGKPSGTEEDSVVLPVFRTSDLGPILSYTFHLRAFEVTQRVSACGVLTCPEKEPRETLKSHLVTKNPVKLTHFSFEILCRRWPFLVFTRRFFLLKLLVSLAPHSVSVDSGHSLPCHLSVGPPQLFWLVW